MTQISTASANSTSGDPIAYGVHGNPDLLLVGTTYDVLLRTSPHPAPLTAVTQPGGMILDVTIDPHQPSRLFANSWQGVRYWSALEPSGPTSPASSCLWRTRPICAPLLSFLGLMTRWWWASSRCLRCVRKLWFLDLVEVGRGPAERGGMGARL